MKPYSFEERQSLGRVIATERRALNLTQDKLSAGSGVPPRTIQRAECGDGISQENLDALANSFGTTASVLLARAAAQKDALPELRLKLPEVTTASALVKATRGKGSIHVGPEGEDAFNEHIGGSILELASVDRREALKDAEYIIHYSRKMGFRIFSGSYQERTENADRLTRNPTTLIIAAPELDLRVRRTSKGFMLDYVMDTRKHGLHSLLKRIPTSYDWMEEQVLSRSNGEERVRHMLRRLHAEVKTQIASKRRLKRTAQRAFPPN